MTYKREQRWNTDERVRVTVREERKESKKIASNISVKFYFNYMNAFDGKV